MADSQAKTQTVDPFGWVGATIDGKYRVDRVVGEGGFGVVYQATDLALRESVAVKCLKLGPSVKGVVRDRFLESFLAEGKLLRRLSKATTGIVQAHQVGAAESPSGQWTPYLVLEWLEGRTLAEDLGERLARSLGGRSLADAIDLLDPAAKALEVVHEENIAHRDLKPENLFLAQVGRRWTLKVLDFGVAKVMGDMAQMTAAAAVTGIAPRAFSPAYGAPEQFEPVLGATGPWTDVYALALVLLEVVTGQHPYVGESSEELRNEAVDQERRPSFSRLDVGVPDQVEQVMRRALAVDPRNRFPTVQAFWTELRRAGQDAPPTSRRKSATEPASDPQPRPVKAPRRAPRAPVGTTSPVTAGPQPRRQRAAPVVRRSKSRFPAWGYALVAFLLLGGGATTGLHTLAAHKDNPPADMVLVPEGRYTIGSPSGDVRKCEGPQHMVYVLPFFIDRTEVAVSDYRRCEKAGKCSSTKDHAIEQKLFKGLELCNEMRAERGERLDDNPINCVDRGQAAAYCASVGKRLPTDEEWEAAARGPSGAEYPWGNTAPSCDKAVFGRPPGNVCPGYGTARIASTPATSGVFDLAGNVWEWTSTVCPGAPVLGSPASSAGTIPDVVPTTSPAVDKEQAQLARLLRQAHEPRVEFDPGPGTLRGGGFEWSADSLRSWKRIAFQPTQGGVSTGFRCAKDAP